MVGNLFKSRRRLAKMSAPVAPRRRLPPRVELLEDRLAPAILPAGFTEALVTGGIDSPTDMEFAPDGRLFVLEQAGRVRVIQNGTLLPTPFLTLPNVQFDDERGLLGVAFDPDFATNRYLYLYYTANSANQENRVSRFTADGNTVVPDSEVVLVTLGGGPFHVAGGIHFGPDGMLYVASGDASSPDSPQSLDDANGKLLRFRPDGTIPTDNPFYDQATGPGRATWALGLRNPFRFAVDPLSGRILINDVGGGKWEEINEGIAGSNYGWPNSEGARLPTDVPTTIGTYRDPIYYYGHKTECAITGGTFYSPSTVQFPSNYVGQYFFADFCGRWIKVMDQTTGTVTDFGTELSYWIVDLAVGPDGSLYYLNRGLEQVEDGQIFKIEYSDSPSAPTITHHPASQTVPPGGTAIFTVFATGTLPLSYQWQRNGVNIPGATASSHVLESVTAADSGAQFRVVVSNELGTVTSNPATLTVTTNRPPVANIITPTVGSLYRAGETIFFQGTAVDPEDGPLPASAFTWQVDWYTGGVQRPALPATSGVTSGSYPIPTLVPYLDPDVFYRVILTVRDSQGLTTTVTRDVFPRLSTLTVASNISGLQVTLDGQPRTAPYSTQGVVGLLRSLGVVSPQTVGGVIYEFVSWSDGGAATHTITTPDNNTTYMANYQARTTLAVSSFMPTATGFVVQFNQSVSPATLNLFETQTGGPGPADLTLVATPGGPLAGSLVVSPDGRTITFLRTGGVLPAGSYTVTLRSAPDGFRTPAGGLLDGDGDGIPSDYTTTFTIAPSLAPIVSVPDFMRGPGQPVSVPADSTRPGLHLRLSEGVGVTRVDLILRWNQSLLSLSAPRPGPDAPDGATVVINPSDPEVLSLTLTSPTPLGPGPADFITLTAQVPLGTTSAYGSKHILDIINPRINDNTAARDDDGLHVVGYLGDTTGNGGYSALDVSPVLRVAVGLDTGFDAYRLVDPVIIADINGNNSVTTLDAIRILQESIGIDRPEIPPPGPPGVMPGGPDPFLNLPTDFTAAPGAVVTVPVNLDLSDGLEAADLALSYDPQRLEVLDVQRGSLTEDFDVFAVNLDAAHGTIRAGLGRTGGVITGRGSGSVLLLTFRVRDDAPAGPAIINLRRGLGLTTTQLNEGGLDLIPDPSDEEGDVLDGLITITSGDPPAPVKPTPFDPNLLFAMLKELNQGWLNAPTAGAAEPTVFESVVGGFFQKYPGLESQRFEEKTLGLPFQKKRVADDFLGFEPEAENGDVGPVFERVMRGLP